MSPLSTWPGFFLFAVLPTALAVFGLAYAIRRRAWSWIAWSAVGVVVGLYGGVYPFAIVVLAAGIVSFARHRPARSEKPNK